MSAYGGDALVGFHLRSGLGLRGKRENSCFLPFAQIRSTVLQLRELQDRPNPDQGRIDDLTNRVEWDTRIFEERRKTMNFVCEVPVLIEQRLFALARAIQQSLE
jgi:16S rRNA A1518/A1519 N6-dimethyltransferase RsmA/KsgA/DIM1 with predicted DNA glycosylase/AP lyase activity